MNYRQHAKRQAKYAHRLAGLRLIDRAELGLMLTGRMVYAPGLNRIYYSGWPTAKYPSSWSRLIGPEGWPRRPDKVAKPTGKLTRAGATRIN